MTPRGQIRGIAQHAVCPPDHEVSNAGNNVEAAARAQVRLHGLCLGDRLDVPFAPSAHLDTTPSGGEALHVELGMRLTRTGRSAP